MVAKGSSKEYDIKDKLEFKPDEKKPENYTTNDIYVEVGLESGYYAQVTGDGIKEGLEVEIPGGDTSLEDIFNGMNAAGGM